MSNPPSESNDDKPSSGNSGGLNISGGSTRDISYNDSRGATINNYYGPLSNMPRTQVNQNASTEPPIPIKVPDRDLTSEEKFKIVDLLGRCPSMQNLATRELVVSELSFANNIPASSTPKLHITQIVSTCQHYQNGLHDLFQSLSNFDGATKEYRALLTYVDSLNNKA